MIKSYLPLALCVICIFVGAYFKLEHIKGGQVMLGIGMVGIVLAAVWMARTSE